MTNAYPLGPVGHKNEMKIDGKIVNQSTAHGTVH